MIVEHPRDHYRLRAAAELGLDAGFFWPAILLKVNCSQRDTYPSGSSSFAQRGMMISAPTPATTVLWLINQSQGAIWLDGGWGVDALIGTQTRAHEDVDIVLEERHAPLLIDCLRLAGFEDVPRDDTRPCNFVLGLSNRGLVDFHLVRFDPDGNGIYGIPEPEGTYPAEAFTGRGKILGQPVRCMSANYQMENHSSGYELRAKDFADMQALAAATGMSLPKHFR